MARGKKENKLLASLLEKRYSDVPRKVRCTQCGSWLDHLDRWNHWCQQCSDWFTRIERNAVLVGLTLDKKGKCVTFQHLHYSTFVYCDSLDAAEAFIEAYSPNDEWTGT